MSKTFLAAALLAAYSGGLLSGCVAPRVIDSATTKISMTGTDGKSFELALPKELDATQLSVTIDPRTGVIELKADQLRSSSSGVIQSAGTVQAETLNRTAGILENLARTVVPVVTRGLVPAPASPPAPPGVDLEGR